MSKNRLKLTNEDLRDVFDFRKYLKMPERQYYCKIYGIVYADKDGTELFDTKEECIESFMTSPIFEPLWSKLCDIVTLTGMVIYWKQQIEKVKVKQMLYGLMIRLI